jgi:hypothetical protein
MFFAISLPFLLFQSGKMSVETVIGLSDQLAIEAFLTNPGFVASYEQNGLAFRIESKSYTPLTVCRTKPQFFHIGVTGSFQRVHTRPSQLRPELLQETSQSQHFRAYILVQLIKLRFELLGYLDRPCQLGLCLGVHHAVKCMSVLFVRFPLVFVQLSKNLGGRASREDVPAALNCGRRVAGRDFAKQS